MPETFLAEQFEGLEQQKHASEIGMWIFLSTEVLFFGGLLLAYFVYRTYYPEAVGHASSELNIACGTANTAVLLTSSFTMAMAVRASQLGESRGIARWLTGTWCLGALFLLIKAYEYYDDIDKALVPGIASKFQGPNSGAERLFLYIYYVLTGIHALHLTIGIGVVSWIIHRARNGEFSREYHIPVVITGLYWHFVDIVWIFLYPFLYLMDRYR